MRPSGNKMRHECETIEERVSTIRNRFEDFGQKRKHMEGQEWREENNADKSV